MKRRPPSKVDDGYQPVADDRGRLIGSFKIPGHDALRSEVQAVKDFLIALQSENSKQSAEVEMSKGIKPTNPNYETVPIDYTNIVYLAGRIKSIKIKEDGLQAFVLVDPSGSSKFLPCTVYGEKELVRKVERFMVEDFIQIRGFVRGWSQQKDGKWVNNVDIRITEIKNDPPKRPEVKKQMQVDDDIPF